MAYTRVWPEGWKDNEEGGTYIDAAGLNKMEQGIIDAHDFMARKDNPHEVTKAQVGLGNVPNVATNDQAPTYTAASTLIALSSGEKMSAAMGKLSKAVSTLIADDTKLSGIESGAQKNTITGVKGNAESAYRTGDVNLTPENIGLGNVNNTSDANKPISNATQAALNRKQDALTFDETPTEGSENPVKSGGVAAAVNPLYSPKSLGPSPVVTFSDGIEGAAVQSCVVNIEPVQAGSGDPSPENVRPITGWTAANVIQTGKNRVAGIPSVNNKHISDYGGQGGRPRINCYLEPGVYTISLNVCAGNGTEIGPLGLWTVNAETGAVGGGNGGSRSFTDDNGELPVLQSDTWTRVHKTATFSAPISQIRLGYYKSSYYISYDPSSIQIEAGSALTDLEPYTENRNISIPFGESGTVYGGTLDFATGVLTVTHGSVDLGAYTWEGSTVGNRTVYRSTLGIRDKAKKYSDGYCSVYTVARSAPALTDGSIAINGTYWSNTATFTVLYDTRFTSEAEVKEALAGQMLVYELETPLTYHLTPQQVTTLLGENNIYADCGSVSVTYRGDVPNLYRLLDATGLSVVNGKLCIGYKMYEED